MHVSRGLTRIPKGRSINIPKVPRPCRLVSLYPVAPQQPRSLILYSTNGKDPGEKSWGEIFSEAGNLARTSFTKLKDTVSSALTPKSQAPPPESDVFQQQLRRRHDERLTRPSGADELFPGLFGKVAGSLLGGALDIIGKEMAKSSRDLETVLDEARRRIANSPIIKTRMGNVQVLSPTSQSSSSMNINGRSTQRINLVTPIQGSTGMAYGQVEYVSEGGKRSSCVINVRMPEGDVVRVDEVDASGQTIDVDFREIR